MNEFTHLDGHGVPRMVDVGEKAVTRRWARASACIRMRPETLQRIEANRFPKGDVLSVARLAGIMAAKRTPEWIPLCHPLPLDAVEVSVELEPPDAVRIEADVRVTARTGVEMEALVAASTAALTVYDMCKSVDREMIIEQIQLEEKGGGRSGMYVRAASAPAEPRADGDRSGG